MTLKTSSSEKQLCLSKYQQKYFPSGFFSTNTGYCFLPSFFLPMSAPPAALGFPGGAETISLPMWDLGQYLQPSHTIQPFSPLMAEYSGIFSSLCALDKIPLQNTSMHEVHTLPCSSDLFLKQLHSLQKLWQLNLAAFHTSRTTRTC